MSTTMFKDGISKVVHNREIAAAKKAGWTYSPEAVKVKLRPRPMKNRLRVSQVDLLRPQTITDLPGPQDLNKEGD